MLQTLLKAIAARSMQLQLPRRFLCRAKQAEVAKAKARTQYVPEGPPVEGDYEEKSAVLQKRKHAEQVDSEWQFWNSYFQKVPTATARKAMAVKQQQQQRAKESAKGPPSDDEEDRLSDNADDDSDDDYCHRFYREEECPSDCTNPCDTSEYDSYSEDEHQCHCLSPLQNPSQGAFQLAFRQLVMFVKNLQDNVCNNPAAARLKTFATLQVRSQRRTQMHSSWLTTKRNLKGIRLAYYATFGCRTKRHLCLLVVLMLLHGIQLYNHEVYPVKYGDKLISKEQHFE